MIEFAALAAAFTGGLAALEAVLRAAGVPIPPRLADAMTKGLPGVVELLEAVGCVVSGCPTDEPADAPPAEHEEFRDAMHALAEESIGVSRR